MHLLRSELPDVQQALTDSAAFLRVRGFSVAADHADRTRDVLDLEILLSGDTIPISGSDYNIIVTALARVGGQSNEDLANLLVRRALTC